MSTLTYCKGLPTPADELNTLGFTTLEMFLYSFALIFHKAVCETVFHLLHNCLGKKEFDKSKWNTHLQHAYGISKRHANGVISYALGAVDEGGDAGTTSGILAPRSAKECRANHIKILTGKLRSIEAWIKKEETKLKNAQKFYKKKNWKHSKTGCGFPLSYSLEYRNTNWQYLRFQIHNKKRRAHHLRKQIEHLKNAPIRVRIPLHQVFIVGSKDEKYGNHVCQWDGNILRFRVPSCLESQFGEYVESRIGNFDRKNSRLPITGAKTWHFYRKSGKWCIAVQFTPAPVERVSRHSNYGCIGIDMNPGSIGWAYVDLDGNLKAHGQIPLQMGLPHNAQNQQIVDACLQLAVIASNYACPVVCEELDFSRKKESLREGGRKYARMLSGWAYSRFYKLLESILSNRGIYLMKVNSAYTSVIGLVKYVRQYGLASDEAAAIAIARRGMRLTEQLPSAITAYLEVNSEKHVWHWWSQLNNLIKKSSEIGSRHKYYQLTVSNWESLVKRTAKVTKAASKRKR